MELTAAHLGAWAHGVLPRRMGMLMPIFPAIDEHGQAAMPNRFMPPMGMSGQDGMSPRIS